MTRLSLCLIALIACSFATGCATVEPPKAEPLEYFSRIQLAELPDVAPVEVPATPKSTTVTATDGAEYVAFTAPQAKKLLEFMIASKANTEILHKARAVIDQQDAERHALVLAGRGMEDRANFLLGRLNDTKYELAEEKKAHQLDNLLGRLMTILSIAVGLAL